MSMSSRNSPTIGVSEATPQEDLPTLNNENFSRRIAHQITIPHPFHQVAALMSLEKDFYPLVTRMASLEYNFPSAFPLQVESPDDLLHQIFNCYKLGLEQAPGSKFQYVKVESTDARLHRTYMQVASTTTSTTFKNFYKTVIASASDKNPQSDTIIHYETGFTAASSFSTSMASNLIYPALVHTDKVILEQMYCWIVTPLDAARRQYFRDKLITANPIASSDPCEYATTASLACSTDQVLNILKNKRMVVENIIHGSAYNESSKSFSLELQPMGQFIMNERTKSGAILSYEGKMTLVYKFTIDFKEEQGVVSVRTKGTSPLVADLKMLYKENLGRLSATMFGRLATEIAKANNISNITPELDLSEVVPVNLRARLGFN